MSTTILELTKENEKIDSGWKSLYKLGGIAALITIPIFLLDIIISFGGGDIDPQALTAIDWFSLFQDNWILGLRLLGIINIITLTVTIPLYFALYASHRNEYRVYATLALILYLIGIAVYISNNAAIPMYVLSNKYIAATTDVQRTLIAAAGEAIIAKGADFTPGSFIGFFFTELAGIIFSIIMLCGNIFRKITAYLGLLGFLFLIIFTIGLTFNLLIFDIAMLIAMFGGFLSMTWYVLTAQRLIKLSKNRHR